MEHDKKILERDWETLFKKYEISNSIPLGKINVGNLSVGFVNGLRVIGYNNTEGDVKDLKWDGKKWTAEEKEYCGTRWYDAGINETDMRILTEYYNALQHIIGAEGGI